MLFVFLDFFTGLYSIRLIYIKVRALLKESMYCLHEGMWANFFVFIVYDDILYLNYESVSGKEVF